MNPRLRLAIDIHPIVREGQPALLLRDSLELSDRVVVLPQALRPLLGLCDGSRSVTELRADLVKQTGLAVSRDVVQKVIQHLDDALLLEGDRFEEAWTRTVDEYRSAPFRPPALADSGYPADPKELDALLDSFAQQSSSTPQPEIAGGCQHTELDGELVGLVSPHIDYARGGPVYARVWGQAVDAVRRAELVVIFGTDHRCVGDSLMTLTRQNYATPYGVLPTAVDVVDELTAVLGEEDVFAEEMNHLREHSIELAAVWLHHTRGAAPCPVVPILCGALASYVKYGLDPAEDKRLDAAVEVLRKVARARRTLVVAAADLAHVGPAFHDPFPVDFIRYLALEAADQQLLETIEMNDASAFFAKISAERNRRNVCGVAPIYLALRTLAGKACGQLLAYDRCPADTQQTSYVSICGMVWREVQHD